MLACNLRLGREQRIQEVAACDSGRVLSYRNLADVPPTTLLNLSEPAAPHDHDDASADSANVGDLLPHQRALGDWIRHQEETDFLSTSFWVRITAELNFNPYLETWQLNQDGLPAAYGGMIACPPGVGKTLTLTL